MHAKTGQFGLELHKLRTAAHKTLADVARVLNVSVTYISDIERSRRNPPPRRSIALILDEIGASDHLERLCLLAAEFRGSVQLEAKTEKERRILVALERRLENLSGDDADRVLKILEG